MAFCGIIISRRETHCSTSSKGRSVSYIFSYIVLINIPELWLNLLNSRRPSLKFITKQPTIYVTPVTQPTSFPQSTTQNLFATINQVMNGWSPFPWRSFYFGELKRCYFKGKTKSLGRKMEMLWLWQRDRVQTKEKHWKQESRWESIIFCVRSLECYEAALR